MEPTELPTGGGASSIGVPSKPKSNLLTDIIDIDDDQEWWDESAVTKHHEMMSDFHRTEVNALLKGGGTHVGTIFRRKRYGKTRAEIRFDGIAGCLRTPRGGSAKQIVIVVHKGSLRMRWMSPVEYARLQGAGDYRMVGTRNQRLLGFGDAVCVPVIRWIDEKVLTPLYEAAVPSNGR